MTNQEHSQLNDKMGASYDAPRLDPFDDDVIAHTFISKTLLKNELELYGIKWFDYRQLTPLAATRLYIEAFEKAYERHYAANFDKEAAKYARPVTVDYVMARLQEAQERTPPDMSLADQTIRAKRIARAKTNFSACWRGRQVADYLGMPYDVYLDLAFTFRLDNWQQRNMPQAVHLYLNWVVEKVQVRWEELQERRLYLSDEPVYLVQNYVGAQHQDDYHEWLFSQANLRSNPPMFIAQFVDKDILPLEKVESRLDEHQMERVRRHLLH